MAPQGTGRSIFPGHACKLVCAGGNREHNSQGRPFQSQHFPTKSPLFLACPLKCSVITGWRAEAANGKWRWLKVFLLPLHPRLSLPLTHSTGCLRCDSLPGQGTALRERLSLRPMWTMCRGQRGQVPDPSGARKIVTAKINPEPTSARCGALRAQGCLCAGDLCPGSSSR